MDITSYRSHQIYIYPIKSGPPVRRRKLEWDNDCLPFDRYWMIVKASGEMVTLRGYPQLNTLVMEEKESSFVLGTADDSVASIEFPKQDEASDKITVDIWGQRVEAFYTQNQLADWVSEFLGEKMYVIFHPERSKSVVRQTGEIHMKIQFQDGYPVHIVNTASVQWLKEVCKKNVHPLQFRANIYVDLKKAFIEDHIEHIIINDQTFLKVKDCDRCMVINLHHGSDVFYKEPLASLSTWRRKGNHVYFGFYAKPVH